jgi:hypothetical protein
MPDPNSPRVTRAEEDSHTTLIERGDESRLNRKWWCPSDYMIAGYTDGVLGKRKRAWVEFHLARCHRCRLLIADVVKAQREPDLSLPPVQVFQKAIGLVPPRPAPRRWVWVPLGALAGIALLAVFTIVPRKPQQLVVVKPAAPAAPLIAKSEPAPAVRTPVPDIVRKPRTPESLPTILSPQADSVVSSDRLQFSWKPIPHTRNYGVQIVKSDGDLLWEGQTDKSVLQLPTEVTVGDGSYFVWITAYLEDGRTEKSEPVRFQIKR